MHFVNFKLQICFPVHNCPFSNLLAANGFQNRLRTASSQGIAALAAQGSVAPLTEQSDETFSVGQFSSADRE
jgi:hypothetical protein